MSQDSGDVAMRAGAFHAGNTCPYCQEIITEGQVIVQCARCGSLHHDSCWRHNNGCSSYHCDTKARRDADELHPELVVTASELDNVTVPPKPVRLSPEQAAKPYLPPQPAAMSKLAVASVVLAVLSLFGLAGVFLESVAVVALGIAAAILAIATGVVALVVINTGRKVYGFAPASVGVMLSAFLVTAFFGYIAHVTRSRAHDLAFDMQISENMPTESELESMEPWRSHALRANVVIKTAPTSFRSRAYSYGSGVILKTEGRQAFILTNKHVIGAHNSSAMRIVFYNGEESTAKVEWLAPGETDLAIISCEALTMKDYEPSRLAPAVVAQGERVFAIGNPMNLPWSYTEGVISGIRQHEENGKDVTIYQTQTPINQGNSGGGLYDMTGLLIGINTWTKDKSVTEGLNFAISTRSILELLDDKQKERFLGSE